VTLTGSATLFFGVGAERPARALTPATIRKGLWEARPPRNR
jgi:hypothetical protein